MKANKLSKILLKPIVLVTFICVAAVWVVGLYSFQESKGKVSQQSFDLITSLFKQTISDDLITGTHSEVYEKCRTIIFDPLVLSIEVKDAEGKIVCAESKDVTKGDVSFIERTLYYDQEQEEIAGHLKIGYDQSYTETIFFKSVVTSGIIVLLLLVLLYFLIRYTIQKKLVPLENISRDLKDMSLESLIDYKISHDEIDELQSFSESLNAFSNALEVSQQKLVSAEKERAVYSLARQIAHDIRSPLELLKGQKNDLVNMPENSRRLVQLSINRIEEIAYNLLKANSSDASPSSDQRPEELLSILESILLEKKFEHSLQTSLTITGDFSSESYGLISKVRRGDLKRVISNLINNAVEAIEENVGIVTLRLYEDGDWNVIEVEDNGHGISDTLKEKIFTQGFTSKATGHGLGLSGARDEVVSLGGEIQFESTLNVGTVFKIFLPKASASQTFVKKINSYMYDKVIVLDDDQAIHEIWKNKFKDQTEKVEYFFSIQALFKKYTSLPPKTLLLTDFELMDDHDGIDAILKYDHVKNSILVTARSEEILIQERCNKNNIKLLSKRVLNYIEVISKSPSIVLIEDDKLTRINWRNYFEARGIAFKSYVSVDEFLKDADNIDFDSIIYIDSHLGEHQRGEIESEKIFNLGYKNLFLSTGYEKNSIEKPFWIKDVYPKNPEIIFSDVSL